jgi:hypothetical protein
MLRDAKEQIAKMKRFRVIGVAFVAVLALGALVASSAQATSPAPYWTINGTRLVAGKTHNIASRITAPFVLTTPEQGSKIECSGLEAKNAVLLGSNEGTPGRDNEITKFSGCLNLEGNGGSECEISEGGTITTNPLISEQVESVSGTGGGKQLLEEFFPASGANFVTLHFKGAACTLKETSVSGQVVAEVLLDNAGRGKIELGQTPEQATSWILKFPATPIKEVWLIANGEGKIVKTKQVTFGDPSTQTGEALVLLANTKLEPEYALWSPLP